MAFKFITMTTPKINKKEGNNLRGKLYLSIRRSGLIYDF